MEQIVTRDEFVAHIDRVISVAKSRMGSVTSMQSLLGDMIKTEVLMKFDARGNSSFCGKRFRRK